MQFTAACDTGLVTKTETQLLSCNYLLIKNYSFSSFITGTSFIDQA